MKIQNKKTKVVTLTDSYQDILDSGSTNKVIDILKMMIANNTTSTALVELRVVEGDGSTTRDFRKIVIPPNSTGRPYYEEKPISDMDTIETLHSGEKLQAKTDSTTANNVYLNIDYASE